MLLRWDNQVSQLYILDNNGRLYTYDFYKRKARYIKDIEQSV